MKKYKKYNKIIILSLLLFIFIVSALNFIIDPYYVFNHINRFNQNREYKDKNHRFSKIPAFKLYKNNVCSVWVGSSKSWEGSNEEYESKTLNCEVKNLAVSGSSFDEAVTMAKNAMIIHPEIKTIYFGVDFIMMKKIISNNSEELRLVNNKNLKKEEVLPLILSLETFRDSLRTINKNLKKRKISNVEYGEEKEHNKRYLYKFRKSIQLYNKEHYNKYVIDDKHFDELRNLINFAKEKGIKIEFFTTTMHITERILIENTNNSENFYRMKEKLAEIQPYYDFAIVNEYTTEELSADMKCFRDAVHNMPFLRKKLTNKLFTDNSDFGILITKDNVNEMNEEDKLRFEEYVEKNPNLITLVEEWSK